MFRGIRQNGSGIIDLAFSRSRHSPPVHGDGGAEERRPSTSARGTALHTATPELTARRPADAASCGTSRTSMRRSGSASAAASLRYDLHRVHEPELRFTTVKEFMFKLSVRRQRRAGQGRLKPYVALARRLRRYDDRASAGGGGEKGHLLELGVAPGYAARRRHRVPDQGRAERQGLLRVRHRRGLRSSASSASPAL